MEISLLAILIGGGTEPDYLIILQKADGNLGTAKYPCCLCAFHVKNTSNKITFNNIFIPTWPVLNTSHNLNDQLNWGLALYTDYSIGNNASDDSRIALLNASQDDYNNNRYQITTTSTGITLSNTSLDSFTEKHPLSASGKYLPGHFLNIDTLTINLNSNFVFGNTSGGDYCVSKYRGRCSKSFMG